MSELPVEILHQAVRSPEHHSHPHVHAKTAAEGGAVVVDTIDGAMTEAGEIIDSGIGGQGVVELGELVMLKRSHWAEKAEREERERARRQKAGKKDDEGGHGISHLFKKSHKSDGSQDVRGRKESEGTGSRRPSRSRSRRPEVDVQLSDGGLHDWLQRGNVIYKSVGIGLMDVVVGLEIVRLAEERGVGTTFEDFN